MTDPKEYTADHLQIDQINGLIAAAGVDGVKEILNAFWRSTSDLLDGLKKQVNERAYDEIARTAHAIKGSAANVGAQRLAQACCDIEDACRTENGEKLDTRLAAIHEDFDVLQAHFEAHLANAA